MCDFPSSAHLPGLHFFSRTLQIAEIYILSQPFMVRVMATEPPVISLQPGNFTLDIPASIVLLAQTENSTAEAIVSMDFVRPVGAGGQPEDTSPVPAVGH